MPAIQSAYPTLARLAAIGTAGFALQNATPTILTWTAPNDGQSHRIMLIANQHTTSAGTGGAVSITLTLPDGGGHTYTVFSANPGAGFGAYSGAVGFVVQPGSTVTLAQTSALTAGAATIFAEIWGS